MKVKRRTISKRRHSYHKSRRRVKGRKHVKTGRRVKSRRRAKGRGRVKSRRHAKGREQKGGMWRSSKQYNMNRDTDLEDAEIFDLEKSKFHERKKYNYNTRPNDHGMRALLKAYWWIERDRGWEEYTTPAATHGNPETISKEELSKVAAGIVIVRYLLNELKKKTRSMTSKHLQETSRLINEAFVKIPNHIANPLAEYGADSRTQNKYGYQAELCMRLLQDKYIMKAYGREHKNAGKFNSRAERHISYNKYNAGTFNEFSSTDNITCKPTTPRNQFSNHYRNENGYMSVRKLTCTTLTSPGFSLSSRQLREIDKYLGENPTEPNNPILTALKLDEGKVETYYENLILDDPDEALFEFENLKNSSPAPSP